MLQISELLLTIFRFVADDDPSLYFALILVQRFWKDLIYNHTCVKYLLIPHHYTKDQWKSFLNKSIDNLTIKDFLSLCAALRLKLVDSVLFDDILLKLEICQLSITYYVYGYIYRFGFCGYPKDSQKALEYWNEGKKLNEIYSMVSLVIETDDCSEIHFYRLNKGYLQNFKNFDFALNNVGLYFFKNNNLTKAAKYFKKSAALGNSCAKMHWAWLLFKHLKINNNFVLYLLKSSCIYGDEFSYYTMGCYFYETQNYVKAEKAFLNGVHLGSDLSLYFLGRAYLMMGKDNDAFRCFLTCSEKGDQNATFRLADCYIHGVGVQQDKQKGYNLLQSIVSGGNK